jgi:Divergent InlB B-repeat domain
VRRLLFVAALALTGLWAVPAQAQASTWCGSAIAQDRQPQVVLGPSVHVLYVIPADGTDRLAELGSVIQTDVEAIDAWWRGQDPARTPRFDLFAYPCGAQVDISDVRLNASGADLAPSATRFSRLLGDLSSKGFTSAFEKYLIYYDGPGDATPICGQGGGSLDGLGVAIVYLSACLSEPTSVTAAHEMTHSFGAVPAGAPHNCPSPNAGHVCDSQSDLMYPVGYGTPLASLFLDVNHDDYYGLSSGGTDIRNSRWLRHLDRPSARLSVVIQGGAGTVGSDVPGISCAASCESDWDADTTLGLTATPPAGKRFVRWSGACTGTGSCLLTLTGPTAVTALFAPTSYPLAIRVNGKGAILSNAAASVCRSRCRLAVPSYEPLSLRAVASPGWRFVRWGGTCHGTRPACTLPMSAASSATALFTKKKTR